MALLNASANQRFFTEQSHYYLGWSFLLIFSFLQSPLLPVKACRKSEWFCLVIREVLMRVLVRRHHHNGRWEARIGYACGKKYLYLGTFCMCLFLGLPLHFASTDDRKKPHFCYKITAYRITVTGSWIPSGLTCILHSDISISYGNV